MVISCPHCGPRDEVEFHYGGQAGIAYPSDPQTLSDAEWGRYLFVRANDRGPYDERWQHLAGCRRWFNLTRDTLTHVAGQPYPVDESAPGWKIATQENK